MTKTTKPTKENPLCKPVANFWVDDFGIVHIKLNAVKHHGIEEARVLVDIHNELAENVPCPVLCDLLAVQVGADRAARMHYVTGEASRLKTGLAMLVNSPIQTMLGNIFLRMNRPPYPTRLFRNHADAMTWLKTFLPTKS